MKFAKIGAIVALGLGTALMATAIAGPGPTGPRPDGPRHPLPGGIAGGVFARGDDGRAAPVGDAIVTLGQNASDRPTARTRTNDRGQFRFEDVRPGRYIVRAAKDGVGRGQAATTVRPRTISHVRILLGR